MAVPIFVRFTPLTNSAAEPLGGRAATVCNAANAILSRINGCATLIPHNELTLNQRSFTLWRQPEIVS